MGESTITFGDDLSIPILQIRKMRRDEYSFQTLHSFHYTNLLLSVENQHHSSDSQKPRLSLGLSQVSLFCSTLDNIIHSQGFNKYVSVTSKIYL